MAEDLKNYFTDFPNLPFQLCEFFSMHNARTADKKIKCKVIGEFTNIFQNSPKMPQPGALIAICDKLCRHGKLSYYGQTYDTIYNSFGLNNAYIGTIESNLDQKTKAVVSKYLDFIVYGFPIIYDCIKNSVIPIIHENSHGRQSIGSSFVIDDRILVTASHCVEGASALSIRGIDPEHLRSAIFHRHSNKNYDISVIVFNDEIFENKLKIISDDPELLSSVMALGFPVVAGFHPALAAEKALISSRLVASTGAIASTPTEIFANVELLLITARVRGGFSGGPVVNEEGYYVGMTSREATSQRQEMVDQSTHVYDDLGYGTVIPSKFINQLVESVIKRDGIYSEIVKADNISFCEFSD